MRKIIKTVSFQAKDDNNVIEIIDVWQTLINAKTLDKGDCWIKGMQELKTRNGSLVNYIQEGIL